MSFNEKMTAIADKIRDWTHKGGLLTLDDMPDAIQQACELSYCDGEGVGYSNGWSDGWDIGYADGESAGIDIGYTNGYFDGESAGFSNGQAEGFAQGEQAEYDRFWDDYQDYGNRTSYAYAFAGQAWTDETYNPKYPINATSNSNALFVNNAQITDTKVPINLGTTTGNKANMFDYATNLVTIRELTWDCNINFAKQFTSCKNLKNITFNGTITRDINMQWCPLTVESMLSIVNHLKDYTNTEYSGTYMLTLSADCWNRLEAYYAENQFDFAVGGSGFADIYPTMKEYVQYALGWAIG